eukprot:403365097
MIFSNRVWVALMIVITCLYHSTLFIAYPEQNSDFLVESMKYCQEVYFPNGTEYERLNDHPHFFKLVKVLDYGKKYDNATVDAQNLKLFNLRNRTKHIPLSFFITIGSNGDMLQITDIFNSLFNHTITLNEAQNDTFYELRAFSFQLIEMGSAFSRHVVEIEAEFISESIRYLVEAGEIGRFNLIGHSMGGLVNYVASQNQGFPVEMLQGMINLCSPVSGGSPQYFNNDIGDLFENILKINPKNMDYLKQNVFHLNLHAGTRDGMVRIDLAKFSERLNFKYTHYLLLNEMKNLFMSLDHNSPLFQKYFMDVFSPSIIKLVTAIDDVKKLPLFKQTVKEIYQIIEVPSNIKTDIKHVDLIKNVTQLIRYPESTSVVEPIQNFSRILIKFDQLYINKDFDIELVGLIDRRFDIQAYSLSQYNHSTQILESQVIRNYYPMNYFKATIKLGKYSDSIILDIKEREDSFTWQNQIENYSPSFDKRTPTKVDFKVEKYHQFKVEIKNHQSQSFLNQYELLSLFSGVEYDLSLTNSVVIHRDLQIVNFMNTQLPMVICLQEYSPINSEVILEYSEYENQKTTLYHLNKNKRCILTYPNILDQDQKKRITIRMYSLQQSSNKNSESAPKINIRPFYTQIVRQSLIDNMWYSLLAGFLVGIPTIFKHSIFFKYISPLLVLLSVHFYDAVLFHHYGNSLIQLKYMDVFSIYMTMQFLNLIPDVLFTFVVLYLVNPIRAIITANSKFTKPVRSFIIKLVYFVLVLSIVTDCHFFLLFVLPVATLSMKNRAYIWSLLTPYRFMFGYNVLFFDRFATDLWRFKYIIFEKYHQYIPESLFLPSQRIQIFLYAVAVHYYIQKSYKYDYPTIQKQQKSGQQDIGSNQTIKTIFQYVKTLGLYAFILYGQYRLPMLNEDLFRLRPQYWPEYLPEQAQTIWQQYYPEF